MTGSLMIRNLIGNLGNSWRVQAHERGTQRRDITAAMSAAKVDRRNLDAMVAHLQGNFLPRVAVGHLLIRR